MASRKPFRFSSPPWTKATPAEALSAGTKLNLTAIASIFDQITEVLVKEDASEDLTRQAQLRSTYPPLKPEADNEDVLGHLRDNAYFMLWADICSNRRNIMGVSGPSMSAARAVSVLREEALDLYAIVSGELEREDTGILRMTSESIRGKLRILEAVLRLWNFAYIKQLPARVGTRTHILEQSSSPDSKTAPAIIAIASIVTLCAFVPVVFAWSHAQDSAGTWVDADFWFLIQNSTMQLLGLFMALYPIFKSKRPSKAPWYWALFFTVLGFVCAVSAVPMYLYLPTFWSGFVSFAGAIAQVSMSVELAIFTSSLPQHMKQA